MIYTVYILTNPFHTVLYIGMTTNLPCRIEQHQQKAIPGFSAQYNTVKLIYAEHVDNLNDARARERQLKSWRREKKEWLINQLNPEWSDLTKIMA